MHEQPDPQKLIQRAELETQVQDFLSNGGRVTHLPSYTTNAPAAAQAQVQGRQRMKFTRKADGAIGYKPVERPPTKKQEMTIMSTVPKKAAVAAKPKVAAAPVAQNKGIPREPSIDLAGLVLQKGVTRPAVQRGGKSAWIPVLLKMEPEQSYFIEGKKAGDLSYVKKIAKREGIAISLYTSHQKNADGEVVEGVLLFRDADGEVADDGLGDGLGEE